MRLYELESDFDLTKKSKNKLFPGGPTFTWDPAKKQWLNPDGTQVARDVHFDLMKAVGLDPQGNKLKPGMIDKIKGAWAKSGAGIDPKASVLGKVMGRVGGAIGNAIGKAVRPKDAQGAAQPDANGDGKPDTPAQQGSDLDTRINAVRQQMKTLNLSGTKAVPKGFDTKIQDAFTKAKVNKDHFEILGKTIVDLDRRGFIVKPYVDAWFKLKQADMQSLDLSRLKILAGI